MRKAISFAAERAAINAVTWWFAPAGGFLAALLMYEAGMPMTFSEWLPENTIVRAAFEVLVCVVVTYVVIFFFWLLWHITFHWLRIRVNPYIAIAVLGALIFAGGLSAYFWDLSRGPILWSYNGNWIAGGYDSGRVIVSGFQFPGYNRSDDPIPVVGTYIRSDLDGTMIDLSARLKTRTGFADSPIQIISADKEFMLSGPIQISGQPMTDNEFRNKFGRFSFFFNSKLVRRFYEKDVDALFTRYVDEGRAATER